MPAVDRACAPAKLTRTLRVTGRRGDGYHLLESEMVALDHADLLEIEEADESSLDVLDEVHWCGGGGSEVGAVPTGADNLVLRALELAGRRARVRLHKRIPPGAGLGGGSSDGAAVLRWAGVLDPRVAVQLGADVPFCVAGGRALVSGIGELVEPLPIDERAFLLCTPPLAVSTAMAYRAYDELGPGAPDPDRRNDLELAATTVEPRLVLWRDLLADVTEHRPQLAGSGSTWYVELDPATTARTGGSGGGPGVGSGGGPTGGSGAEQLVSELERAITAAGARASVALAWAIGAQAPHGS